MKLQHEFLLCQEYRLWYYWPNEYWNQLACMKFSNIQDKYCEIMLFLIPQFVHMIALIGSLPIDRARCPTGFEVSRKKCFTWQGPMSMLGGYLTNKVTISVFSPVQLQSPCIYLNILQEKHWIGRSRCWNGSLCACWGVPGEGKCTFCWYCDLVF